MNFVIRQINYYIELFKRYQFVRFLVVGGINTVFGYSCFAFFIFINLHYAVASFLATICGIIFNFGTIGNIVFKNRDKSLIFKFFGVYTITYICGIIFLKVFNFYNINNYIGGAILILPMAILSFLLNKHFVFLKDCQQV